MSKPYQGSWIIRSMLFAPGHNWDLIEKASRSDADCVVLDLEDAVPEDRKADARRLVRSALEGDLYRKKTVFVRINPIETGLTLRDLEGVACRHLHGFVYPMAYVPDDLKKFDAQLSLIENHLNLPKGSFSLIVLIETPEAVLNAQDIARASSRIVGLLFGCEDYLAESSARHTELDISLHYPRMMVILAARAAGIVPIDTPYIKVHDLDGLRVFARRARDLGMSGMLVMTPRQIAIAHEIYTPTEEEIGVAQSIITAAGEARSSGYGIVVVNGRFVSPPTVKAASKLVEMYHSIQNLEGFSRDNATESLSSL